ncbi:MAG TPA: substrate-binding domain-containing protein [Treponemataceae bacterium]|nr:substrate-binding domain-containing protein [Treponemataceae bacterium]
MKTGFKIALAVSGMLALFSLGMSVFQVRDLLARVNDDAAVEGNPRHYALYIPEQRDSFSAEIRSGAAAAAAEFGISLSVHPLDAEGTSLSVAGYIGADGLVACPDSDSPVIAGELERLRKEGVLVVLAGHNLKAEQPWPFVGTNSFDFGKKAGSLILSAGQSDHSVAVVYSEKSPALFAERELVEMGLTNALRSRLAEPVFSHKTDLNPRSAERTVYELVRSRLPLTAVVFTDPADTIAGTQAIIDLGLLAQVQIIGCGETDSIRDYIDKRIISGSLVVNTEKIGYEAVRALFELDAVGYTSNSVDIGIRVLSGQQSRDRMNQRGD